DEVGPAAAGLGQHRVGFRDVDQSVVQVAALTALVPRLVVAQVVGEGLGEGGGGAGRDERVVGVVGEVAGALAPLVPDLAAAHDHGAGLGDAVTHAQQARVVPQLPAATTRHGDDLHAGLGGANQGLGSAQRRTPVGTVQQRPPGAEEGPVEVGVEHLDGGAGAQVRGEV